MKQQIPLDDSVVADFEFSDHDDSTQELAPDLSFKRLGIVNVIFYGYPKALDGEWVLIDAGFGGTAGLIRRAVDQRFGKGARPAAIVLTHGHFDHIGAVKELADDWDVPIYAHPLEFPFLDGQSAYPKPDPTVGGGLMARMASLYPRGPIDVTERLKPLPFDGTLPGMPGWQWIHTPGHSDGHVSFWREADRTLIAGDAFITTAQESAYSVAMQSPEMHGPPMYYTPDWVSARESVKILAELEPELVVTGHGPAMYGETMRAALHLLAEDFDRIAVPDHGRYVPETAGKGATENPFKP